MCFSENYVPSSLMPSVIEIQTGARYPVFRPKNYLSVFYDKSSGHAMACDCCVVVSAIMPILIRQLLVDGWMDLLLS